MAPGLIAPKQIIERMDAPALSCLEQCRKERCTIRDLFLLYGSPIVGSVITSAVLRAARVRTCFPSTRDSRAIPR